MKKNKDVGLEYIQKLKIKKLRNIDQLLSILKEKYGRIKAEQILSEMYDSKDQIIYDKKMKIMMMQC